MRHKDKPFRPIDNQYVEVGDHAVIKISTMHRGILETKIDKEDIEIAKERTWCVTTNGYVRNSFLRVALHRYIMERHGETFNHVTVCDHINNDRLDNRKKNLRKISFSENALNRRDMKLATEKWKVRK